MKHFFNFRKSKLLLFSLFAMLAGGVSPAWADELTVADGTVTNSYTPFDAGNADYGIKGEYIIPAEELTAMNGTAITSIKLYATTSNTSSKPNYGPFQVFLKEVENATPYSSSSSAFQGMDGATVVYEGTVVVSSKEMLITFSSEYVYNGGNLLIGFYKDKGGNYYSNKFYGASQDGYTGCSSYSSSGLSSISTGTGRMFIPKTTFTYEAANPYKKPATLGTSDITTSSAVVTWTSGSGDDSEIGWNLEYKTSDSESWTEVHSLSASSLTHTLESLSANTAYDVRVCALYNGGESKWISTSFKTEKVSTPATGFVDNFETDKGWELINGTQTNKWVLGTATNNGGSSALYISNDGGATNAYTHSASMTFAAKLFSFEAGDYTITYDWKANGESTYDFLRVALVPASEDLTAGTAPTSFSATALPSNWQSLDGGKLNLQTDWQKKSTDITMASAGKYQVVFAWKNDGSGGNQTPAAAIDNFKIIGAAPVLELGGDVVGTTLAFGSVNETTNKTIRITNSGKVVMNNITLTEISDDDNVFAYGALSKTSLDPSEYMDVLVTFSGSTAKDYTGTFRVAADDCDAIDITVTATYSNSPAQMTVTLGEETVGSSVAFGSVGKQTVKTFIVTNDGDQTLNVTIASDNTTDFTVSPASLAVTGHSSETFTVTFVYPNENPVLDAEKTANITITPNNDGLTAKTFAVTGTRIEQWNEDFSGNSLPEGWEITNSTYWKFEDNMMKGSYSYNNFDLITPSLVVEEGKTMTFDYRMTSTYRSLDIQYSKDNGAWTSLGTISYSGLTLNQWYTYTISGLEAGNYKFRFGDSNYDLDNFEGFKRNMNDPKLGVYSDAGCTTAVTTSVTEDFGFVSDTQTANYYIKNDGTGTMTLSLGENPEGITASLDKTSVAAGEHATLTITMDAANKGYNCGNVVVTATDLGTFTVAVSGVMVEDGKLNLNFATDNIPATWTANDWMKDDGGFIKTGQYGYSNTTMETAKLTAEAGEKLIVVAKSGSTSSSYTFGVKYKKVDATDWSDLIPAANIGTSWTTLVGTIAEAGEYLLQFNGYYASIQRIYGLTEPMEAVMVVYDGENKAGDSYSFGKVTDEAVATHTFTVKNEGKAVMTGLTATLSDDNTNAYNVTVSTESVAVGESATVTVTQLTNIGDHTATLTISADGLESKVIALSGKTVDHTALDVDFANNEWPAGWQHDTNWSVYGEYAYNNNTSTASSIITTPLTISDSSNKLTFEARKDQSSGSNQSLVVRYTTDGGITWTPYNWDTTSAEPVEDLKSQLNTSFKSFEITGINAEKVAFDFYGKSVRIDNIAGDYKVTSAPLMAFANVSDGISGANLKADGTAVYTLANNGNAAYVGTVALNGVTAEVTGEDVTYAENTLTIPVGKTATITVTMAYAAPFGEKTGSLAITSTDWVGDINVNYTADAVDPTEFVEDFEEGKPAGWYLDNWSVTGGEARIYTGVAKAMITEKVGAESGKSTLSFDAKVASGTDEQTLSVSTSTDRKTWSDAQNFTLTGVSQNFSITLTEGNEYYVKFEAANATVDNIKGVKKLTAPATDLYLVSSSMPTENVTPGSTYTATVNVASLIATETVNAELYFGENKIAETTQEVGSNSTAITLTCNAPAAGTYDVYAKVLVGSTTVQTEPVQVVVADTRILTITEFTRTSDANVQADENNEFTATFNVTVQNTGTATLAPNDVKVTLTVGTDAYDFTSESTENLAPNATTTLNLSVKLSAGEGGNFTFKVKENVSNTEYFTSQSVAVTPYATLALNETETYAATVASFGKVTLNRPFIKGWNTLVLPFDIDAATFASKFGADAALYVFTSNTEGELQFTKTTEGVKAGTPYLLNLSAAITDEMTFTDVNVQPGTTAYMHNANNNGAWFYGNYTNGFDMEGKYGITPAGKVQMGGSGSTMKAFRAYITMPEGQSARLAIFDEATGISRVLTTKEVEDMNIFNLKGQRVNENAKGLIIVNGKKVVVK
ncbi:MAG: fibronectin type III domain-containing protein [Prevotella sp.]|nr:fibronectin type III domain-containing protein [Prevotella sp.]